MPFPGELCALVTAVLWAGTAILPASVSSKIGSAQTNVGRMLGPLIFFLVDDRTLECRDEMRQIVF